MRQADPLEALQAIVREHGSQKDAASALGIKPAYLNDLINQRRKFSRRVLEKLGLKLVTVKA